MADVGALAAALLVLTAATARAATRCLWSVRVADRLSPSPRPQVGARTRWFEPPALVRPRLEDAAPPGGAAVAWTAWCGLGSVLAAGAALAVGPVLAVLAGLGWVGAGALALAVRQGATGRAVEEALPEALEATARSLRSGAGTHQAWSRWRR
jgi:Flp pilus assembly protein TadB